MIDKDKLISLLISKEIPVKTTRRYKTIGYRIKLESGTAVYVYDSGGFFCQGNNADQVRKAIEDEIIDEPNNKVFVVYGHDKTARNQLQRLLEELNLEPIFLDNQPIG
ncbi:TIR domain-containing protein, partial [Collinsella aerofaciens]|uniref:TIR domain-containing protein n=2 Tax=Coriobacteriaceae TaxID=84107 RepID=UPI00325AA0D6